MLILVQSTAQGPGLAQAVTSWIGRMFFKGASIRIADGSINFFLVLLACLPVYVDGLFMLVASKVAEFTRHLLRQFGRCRLWIDFV